MTTITGYTKTGADATFVARTSVGAPNGVAGLDADGKLPDGRLPADVARDGEVTAAIAVQAAADSATFVAGRACSTDGTHGLPTPTGVGIEFVINADGLDDIRHNGTSL